MRTLKIMVGDVVIARFPLLNGDRNDAVKLHGVARSGRWVESQDFTNRLMERFQFNSSVTTPLVFLPSDKLDFIVASTGLLALWESVFGPSLPVRDAALELFLFGRRCGLHAIDIAQAPHYSTAFRTSFAAITRM